MKSTFLFGSGADTDASDKLKSGQSFAEALLQNRYSRQIKSITEIDAAHFQLIYSGSKKIYIQTIVVHKDKARRLFGSKIVDDIIYYFYGKPDEDLSKRVSDYCREWYKSLKDPKPKSDEIKGFFLENAVLFDSLDEKFNSLRDIEYNSNAKRVINAYFTVFLLMFESLYDIPLDFEWSYPTVFEKLRTNYDIDFSHECYYRILAGSNIDCNIITTNYTDIAHILTGRNDIIHLHGKMTWFEDLKHLSIFDCTELKNEELSKKSTDDLLHTIPFILIPSGIKPIICKKQIQMFEQFIKALEKSRYLVIVGYKFNSEDNHINSVIAEWLHMRNHKLLYLNYNSSVDFNSFGWADGLSIKKYSGVTEEIFYADIQIADIEITPNNGRTYFKELLRKIQGEKA